MIDLNIWKINWCYFTQYHKHCDNFAIGGATYSFVFNETMPQNYQQPFEFEECVYVGKSSGIYYDKTGIAKGKCRGMPHKRMTVHHKPLTTGKGGETSHNKIIEQYGFGDDVLNGVYTNKPMWLALIIPRPEIIKNQSLLNRWTLHQEQEQLLKYELRFGKCTIGNLDSTERKDPNSYSTGRMNDIKTQDLEKFMVVVE
jgi:hypothetical protein